MTLALASRRTALTPPWVRDDLWRRARAVPSLDLRFADNKSLTDAVTGASLITFTRASSGTYTDSAGVIQTAATDVPRFDHNPTTGESLGLLMKEQRTNLVLQSEDFSGATTFRGSITTNVIAAPDGAITADLFTENTDTGSHTTQLGNVAYTTGVTYTVSIFLRPNGRDTNIRFKGTNTTTFAAEAFFNLTGTGSVASTVAGTASIQALPNGWYRCIIVGVAGATAATGIQVITSSGAGDGTSGIYLWGAQLEAGAFPTSYIPTTAATATHNADVASITGSAFSGWYRQDEGTMFADGSVFNTGSNRFIVAVSDGTINEEIALFWASVFSSLVNDGGVAQANSFGGTVAANTRSFHSFGYKVNDFQGYGNGTALTTDTSGTLPTVDQMTIGSRVNNTFRANGHIRRLTYWPQRLSNEVLQRITQ